MRKLLTLSMLLFLVGCESDLNTSLTDSNSTNENNHNSDSVVLNEYKDKIEQKS